MQINAIRLRPQNPFIWASGLHSPIYCDNRLALSDPETRSIIQKGFDAMLNPLKKVDLIAGVATAGIAHGAILAERHNLPFAYVRAKKKDHGRQNLIEGAIAPGQKVVMIEDLISTGGSSIDAADAVKGAGAEVLAVFAIFQYGFATAKENFENAGYTFNTLGSFPQLIEYLTDNQLFPEEDLILLRNWSSDPRKWSDTITHKSHSS